MEKVIVIGTGKEAEQFLYAFRGKYDVILFADDNPRRANFRGKSVVVLDSVINELKVQKEFKIIIATPFDEYTNISRKLTAQGLSEFKDYLYYKAIEKKIAIFFGNCQCQVVKLCLQNIEEFSQKYWIYPYPSIYENDAWYVPRIVLENCSLLVYQYVKEETNGILNSSSYLVDVVRKNKGLCIRIPNLFKMGKAWFPQSLRKEIALMRPTEHEWVINSDNHDMFIKKWNAEGLSKDEIVNKIKHEQILTEEEIKEIFDEYMERIRIAEQENDIKIYSYIMENYKNELIFTDYGHISNFVYKEYLRQIIKILDFSSNNFYDVDLILGKKGLDMPIYGCVIRALGLTYVDEKQIIKASSFTLKGSGLNIEEYVEEYIYVCENLRNI